MISTGGQNDYIVNVVCDDERFRAIEPEWEALREANDLDHPQFSHRWSFELWQCCKNEFSDSRLRIIRIQLGERIVGIIPLMLRKVRLYRWVDMSQLSFLGNDYNDYCGWLVHPDESSRILPFFFRYVLDTGDLAREWDHLLLKNLSDRFTPIAQWQESTGVHGLALDVREKSKHYFVPIRGTFEDYVRSLSRNFKSDLNKCRNRLEKWAVDRGLRYDIAVHASTTVTKELFDRFMMWQKQRMTNVGRQSSFNNESLSEFVYHYISKPSAPVVVARLDLGGESIAMCFAFQYRSGLSLWIQAYDETYASLSPSKLLIQKLIEHCFASGLTFCDFSRGAHEYKQRWTQSACSAYIVKGYNKRKPLFRLINRLKRLQAKGA